MSTTEESAIQKDVLDPSNKEQVAPNNEQEPEPGAERPLSPREMAMEAINIKRAAEFEQEAGVKLDAAPAVEPAANADEQITRQLSEEPTVLTDGLDRTMVKVKIDGEERTVSIADAVRNYQKDSAATKRLEEATRIRREADEYAVRRTTATAVAETEPRLAESDAPKAGDSAVKEFIAALFEGDEDKAMAAFDKATGAGRSNPTLDPEELAKRLTPAVKQQLLVESALEQFSKDYSEIVADSHLAAVCDGYLNEELANGKPFDKATQEAGKRTRDWVRQKAGVPAGSELPTTPRNERLERKRGIDTIPAANARSSTTEQPQQTTSQTIAEMRAARGL